MKLIIVYLALSLVTPTAAAQSNPIEALRFLKSFFPSASSVVVEKTSPEPLKHMREVTSKSVEFEYEGSGQHTVVATYERDTTKIFNTTRSSTEQHVFDVITTHVAKAKLTDLDPAIGVTKAEKTFRIKVSCHSTSCFAVTHDFKFTDKNGNSDGTREQKEVMMEYYDFGTRDDADRVARAFSDAIRIAGGRKSKY